MESFTVYQQKNPIDQMRKNLVFFAVLLIDDSTEKRSLLRAEFKKIKSYIVSQLLWGVKRGFYLNFNEILRGLKKG